MVLFIATIVIGVLTLLLLLYGKWQQQYWTRRGVPQLNPSLLFGDIQPLVTGAESLQDHFLKLYRTAQTKGAKHIGIYNFWMAEYMPIDLNIIKHILTKDFNHFDSHGMYHYEKDPLSKNMFTLEGSEWKERRAKMTPTFTIGKIKIMFETMLEKTVPLKKVINEVADKNEGVAIKDIMARFTTDVFASIAFGLECNTLMEPQHEFRDIGRKSLKPRLMKFALENTFNYNFLGIMGYRTQPRDVEEYFTRIVKETIKYRESNHIQRKDFIQILLQMKNTGTPAADKGLTEEEIINEAFLFYLGGFEPSSSAMTFAFIELSQHPQIQVKLRQEIIDTLDKYDGKITYDAIMEMEYLDKVIRETLRKYPVVPVIPRSCTKSYKLPGTDLIIEKGTRVHIPIIGLHRDPQYYPNPEEFNPENFSRGNKAIRRDYTWIPFGEGPRICIGKSFGMTQTKVGVVTVIKDYSLSIDERTKLPVELAPSSIIALPKENIFLKVSKL